MTESEIANKQERELGTKPIPKLFFKYSIVTFWGMLAQAIMVILEGVIIGNSLGRNGLAVIAIVMPIETLNLALGGGLGIGMSSICAIKLGKKDEEGARRAFASSFWFMAIIMGLFSMILFLFAQQVAKFLGAPADIINDCVIFIRVFSFGLPFAVLGQGLSAVLRTDEKPGIASFAMGASSLIALAILYYTIFVKRIGILGVGIYYALTLGITFLTVFYFVFNKNTIFKIKFQDIKIDFSLVGSVFKIALPYLLFQASLFLCSLVVNHVLGYYGSAVDLASFGIISSYVAYTILIFSQTMANGLQPIASFNYGAKRYDRLNQLLNVSIKSHLVVILIVTAPIIIFTPQIMHIFAGGDAELITVGTTAIRIYNLMSVLGFTSYFISCYYQAVEKIGLSIIISTLRYLIAIPVMLVLSRFLGSMGVWYSQPIADTLAFVLSIILITKEIKRIKILASENSF